MRDAARELAERLHFLHLRELFTRALKRGLRLPVFGNVLTNPEQAGRPSGIILDHLDAGLQMSDFAARTNDAPLRVKTLSGLAGLGGLLSGAGAVIRMH